MHLQSPLPEWLLQVCLYTFTSSFSFQVELGAPGFPPYLLNSFIKQQPLVVAKLASFLGS